MKIETIIKWKMLDTIVCGETRYFQNLQSLMDDLKNFHYDMSGMSEFFKQLVNFESIKQLELKLNSLKVIENFF